MANYKTIDGKLYIYATARPLECDLSLDDFVKNLQSYSDWIGAYIEMVEDGWGEYTEAWVQVNGWRPATDKEVEVYERNLAKEEADKKAADKKAREERAAAKKKREEDALKIAMKAFPEKFKDLTDA